ncbi:hypothetical protein [Dactylosporangium sp. NPDC051484]|uniref:hypothetical protein n=1 Tax=Dactylosporangium sp. NPDC051484 TaxID=3154942 RepID=UPI00344EFD9A
MSQLSSAECLLSGIDGAARAADAPAAPGVRISVFDTSLADDPTGMAEFTWICLIELPHGRVV